MTSTAISPFIVGDLTQVELADDTGKKKQVWRKQLLPTGTREYEGETLDFSRINPACLTAFDEGAFDAVPFVLALSDNKHPDAGQEGEQLEGDVVKLELADDGSLYGFLDLSNSPKVEETIKKSNGKYGVSCKVEVDYTAKDTKKHFDYALSHVCGTTRPHIKGMQGWRPVELSEEEKERETLDLSGEVEDEKAPKPKPTDKKETGSEVVALELPKDKAERLMAFLADLEKIENAVDDDAKDDKEKVVALPQAAQDQIAAAEAGARRALELAETMQVSAAQERWSAQRSKLLTDGVPPAILNLAEKVMKRHKPVTLEFAEGDTVDATAVIAEILDECKGVITLGDERGHQFSDDSDAKVDKAYADLEENFNAMWMHDGRNV